VLRTLEGKLRALIIDHVGNFLRHRAPDMEREWTLASVDRKSVSTGGIPLRSCLGVDPLTGQEGCFKPFRRTLTECPYCGKEVPPPAVRSSPKAVEGDMVLLDADALAALRGQIVNLALSPGEYGMQQVAKGVPTIGAIANQRKFAERQDAQRALRDAMGLWGGHRHKEGMGDREIQKTFWYIFGCDVFTAEGLNTADAQALEQRIRAAL